MEIITSLNIRLGNLKGSTLKIWVSKELDII